MTVWPSWLLRHPPNAKTSAQARVAIASIPDSSGSAARKEISGEGFGLIVPTLWPAFSRSCWVGRRDRDRMGAAFAGALQSDWTVTRMTRAFAAC